MHAQRLAARPGVAHDRGLANVHHLFDRVELAQTGMAQAVELGLGQQRGVPMGHVADMAQPVVREAHPRVRHRRMHARAAVVSADDHVLDAQHVDRELQGRQAVQIGMHHHIGDVAVDEHLAGRETGHLIRWHPRIRAADPQVLGRLLR